MKFSIFGNNPNTLKQELETIYQSFDNETRNFQLFVNIYDYMEKLKNPILKDKIKEYKKATEKGLSDMSKSKALNGQECSNDELENDLDSIFDSVDVVWPYVVLLSITEVMKKHKNKEPVKFKEVIDNNFTKKYRKFFDFLLYTLHEDIMEYLDELTFLKDHKSDKIFFDKDNSVLYIKGKKVKIKRKADLPLEHYILECLFDQDDKTVEVYYKDVAEEKLRELNYDSSTDWKKYYSACERLQEKIREDAQIADFLIFTTNKTGNVKINPDYLPLIG
ncbi:MAG: hypothetical protein A3I29_01025 [Candidatus Magasanikbacteria bacterium RIFCSPLOWO2_02_FULL_44_11]|uniref:Uncharacterized protein n=2 Tax=Candidatus Magasanikiibacteriota TaxID=1752731 RepID=A0A1F6N9Z4_9BACT|nr:MAG: hypothetical protein A3D53_02160 [Candidatus Magasanikbacteria bacterium RIFCSPHIGHO2_02_FULL_45_10]OGH80681.1 MAG: hypothetical protein A3I29_01025 [Candidatus Magasanikbacteria bacterium RIFCSPLOWO2_02_FULL_44_11]